MNPSGSLIQPRWYVLQTKPFQEVRALEKLRGQQYNCFLPLCRNKKVRPGTHGVVGEPLFSRYLFIQLAHAEQALDVQRIDGVSRVLKLNNRFASMPDNLVSALLNHLHPWDDARVLGDRSGIIPAMESLHELPDGEARALALIELICKTQSKTIMPAPAPVAAVA
jgi:transcriptional antiterminator RfaH